MFVKFINWLLVSVLLSTLIKFGVLLSFDYSIGFWGPFLLIQAYFFLMSWAKMLREQDANSPV
jgi:hypothetical protein